MKRAVVSLLVVAVTVSACGSIRDSRMNPRNWFGESRVEAPTLGPTSDVVDNRALVGHISGLTIESTSSGAIVRAVGVTPSAGWWDPELVPENFGRPVDGVLTFRFLAAAPQEPTAGTSEAARTITAVYALTQAQLDVTSSLVVTGADNSRRARR